MASLLITNLTPNTIFLAQTPFESGLVIPGNGNYTVVRPLHEIESMPTLLRLQDEGVLDIEITLGIGELSWRQFAAVSTGVALGADTRIVHESIMTPDTTSASPGQAPALTVMGTLVALVFTKQTHAAYRIVKIPSNYVGDASFHLHWTKSGDTNEAGKAVKWRIQYVVFNGESNDAAVAPQSVEWEDVYEDAGTTSRIVYRTPNLAAAGFTAGYYVSFKVEAINPAGDPMNSEPALVSADVLFRLRINERSL